MGGCSGGSTGGSINTGGSQTLDVTTEEIGMVYAYGSQDFTTTTSSHNMSIVRTAVGRYTVTLTPPHPNNEYTVVMSTEDDVNRDGPLTHIVEGSMNSAGFDLYVALHDNGQNANPFFDFPLHVAVFHTINTVTDVQLV